MTEIRRPIMAVSGGFDPLHSGHVSLLHAARQVADSVSNASVVVILNSDDWLIRKKGYVFQTWEARAEILRSIRFVDHVVPVDDLDDSVCETLRCLRPYFFGNGGDRGVHNTPELTLCKELNITPMFGLGGGKIDSSSDLVNQVREKARVEIRPWGSFQVVGQGPGFKVKSIVVAPGSRLSYQSHSQRSEYWFGLSGAATAILEGRRSLLLEGGLMCIPVGCRHRLENLALVEFKMIELQVGDYLEEDDIVRYEDDYGRMINENLR